MAGVFCQGQKINELNDSDTVLSNHIKNYFFNDFNSDSCYSGIHFTQIEINSENRFNITFSGILPPSLANRLSDLISKSENLWDRKFLKKCRKKNIVLMLPVFFDISSNCKSGIKIDEKAAEEFFAGKLQKEILFEESIKTLVSRHLSIVSSFENLRSPEPGSKKRCILLTPCYIKRIFLSNKKSA